MAKKDPTDLSVEEKLKTLFQLQSALSTIDEKRALRGELPLEVQDLEDEIEGLNTRVEKIQNEIGEFQKAIAQKKGEITDVDINDGLEMTKDIPADMLRLIEKLSV